MWLRLPKYPTDGRVAIAPTYPERDTTDLDGASVYLMASAECSRIAPKFEGIRHYWLTHREYFRGYVDSVAPAAE